MLNNIGTPARVALGATNNTSLNERKNDLPGVEQISTNGSLYNQMQEIMNLTGFDLTFDPRDLLQVQLTTPRDVSLIDTQPK